MTLFLSGAAAVGILGFLLWALWTWSETQKDRLFEADPPTGLPPLPPVLGAVSPPLPPPPPVAELEPELGDHAASVEDPEEP